jgi:hypothetical protein
LRFFRLRPYPHHNLAALGERSSNAGTRPGRIQLITFNNVLSSVGVDPGNVHLARHQDTRARGRSIYAIWKSPDGPKLVEEYQAVQNRDRFPVGGFVASFVVTLPPQGSGVFRSYPVLCGM